MIKEPERLIKAPKAMVPKKLKKYTNKEEEKKKKYDGSGKGRIGKN